MQRTLHDVLTEILDDAEGGVVVIPADDLADLVAKHPPAQLQTEWGVAWSLPEAHGTSQLDSLETAEAMTANLADAGHEARVVWRGTTDWRNRD
ncbi:hypothetical protein [Arthrobacter sp. 18067]|uniref:hypothetical protein n=1 Tax=Arthrobacter sp. 18067 TaxID=2681413 RepID=UPI00135AA893|nr:hypothetical protein [Arthrobacter sp. 18067]